jgi:hypothetical protein
MNPKSFNIERLAFLISFGVQITPQLLSIVSLHRYAYVENHYGVVYIVFEIFNYIPN